MQRSGSTLSHRRQLRHLLGATMLAGAALSVTVLAAAAAEKPASSCVACHTDKVKLQEEAKGIPIPTGSILQAGKG